ncbi:extracellular solute-binding protein [Nocardioides sp. B-3]|uniref:extracellular solute-binding protein n=1 Tax=Nocardioides sp. B-3 TaxID=2895565 RepID=UPI002152C01C|nr:extracellular solute-binding protein [Nocardioides sp. B-3]
MKHERVLAALASAATVLAPAACAAPEKEVDTTTESGVDAAAATSTEDFGGMDELVKAAQEEGELNVIALPPDWANYGEMIATFEEKYDIEVNSDQPDGASQDEINAANDLAGTDKAPDVFDLGQSVALANTDMFAPYKVETFDEIPAEFKDANGARVNDYGGYMSIGYDSAKVPDVTSLADLLKPEYKGAVALNGDPTRSRRGLQRRHDGCDRQRRLRRRHLRRRGLLRGAEEGRQLPARRP